MGCQGRGNMAKVLIFRSRSDLSFPLPRRKSANTEPRRRRHNAPRGPRVRGVYPAARRVGWLRVAMAPTAIAEQMRRLAKAGCVEAQSALGLWYLEGKHGLEQDAVKGLELIRTAADLGDAR